MLELAHYLSLPSNNRPFELAFPLRLHWISAPIRIIVSLSVLENIWSKGIILSHTGAKDVFSQAAGLCFDNLNTETWEEYDKAKNKSISPFLCFSVIHIYMYMHFLLFLAIESCGPSSATSKQKSLDKHYSTSS